MYSKVLITILLAFGILAVNAQSPIPYSGKEKKVEALPFKKPSIDESKLNIVRIQLFRFENSNTSKSVQNANSQT